MQLSRCLIGQTPLVTNIRVYDSGTLEDGALMMLNASAYSSGAPNGGDSYNFTKAAADNNTAGIDAIGVLQTSSTKARAMRDNLSNDSNAMKIGSDYYADAAVSAGGNYLPCIISPQVMYYAEYYQQADADSGANVITANITASTSTTVTQTDLQDHLDGGFLFSTDRTSSAAYEPGQLRYITASAATGSCTIDSAMKVATTSDFILMLPPYCSRTGMTDDGVGLCSLTDKTADDASVGLATTLLVWDNYARWDGAPLHGLRYWSDKALDGIKGMSAFAEVILTDHLWATSPA